MYTELAKRIKQGDEQALYELIRRCEPWLSSVIYNLSGGSLSSEDIEEIAADSFAAIWFNRDKLLPEKCKGFLCSVAKNKARNRLRDRSRHFTEPLTGEEEELVVCITEDAENEEEALALRRGLDSMEPSERDIMMRRYFYYQPIKTIAEQTELKESTVKSKLRRGLIKLREYLKKEGFDHE